jgi:hypothetical protein
MKYSREELEKAHVIRYSLLWGKNGHIGRPFPKTDEDWRKTPHGAPWDSNVQMAEYAIDLGKKLKEAGLI